MQVLDLGCGSGIIGLLAASRGADVVAVDRSARCRELTQFNAELNGIASKVTVGEALPRAVPHARTAVVVFNAPAGPTKAGGGWGPGTSVVSAVRDAHWFATALPGTRDVRLVVFGLLAVRGLIEDALRELRQAVESAGTRDVTVSVMASPGLTVTREARDGERTPLGSLLYNGPGEFHVLRDFMRSESLCEIRPVTVTAMLDEEVSVNSPKPPR